MDIKQYKATFYAVFFLIKFSIFNFSKRSLRVPHNTWLIVKVDQKNNNTYVRLYILRTMDSKVSTAKISLIKVINIGRRIRFDNSAVVWT